MMDSQTARADELPESRKLAVFGQLCAEAQRFGALVHPEEEGIVAEFTDSKTLGLLAPALFLESASEIVSGLDALPASIRLRILPPREAKESGTFHPGLAIAPESLAEFSRYFVTEALPGTDSRRITRFRFRRPLSLPGGIAVEACQAVTDSLRATIRELAVSARSLASAALFPSTRAPAQAGEAAHPLQVSLQGPSDMAFGLLRTALAGEYGTAAESFPVISPGSRKRNAYAPIIDCIDSIVARLGAGEPASEEENRNLVDLAAGIEFFRCYPYRTSFCSDIVSSLARDFRKAMELYARHMAARGIPAWILLRWPEEFSQECAAFLDDSGLFQAQKGFLVAAAYRTQVNAPVSFCGEAKKSGGLAFGDAIRIARKEIPSGMPGLDAIAAARASLQDPLRLSLIVEAAGAAAGFSPRTDTSFEELVRLVLVNLPEEHSRYLVAVSLSEGVLGPAEFVSFMSTQGFPKAALDCIEEYFGALGFISLDTGAPKPVFREIPSIAKNILPDSGSGIVDGFLRILAQRMKSGKVQPCLAIYRSLTAESSEDPAAQSFALECIAKELALDHSHPGAWTIQDSPCAPWSDFQSTQEAGDREGSAGALTELERTAIPGTPSKALAFLAKAYIDYAEHKIPAAAAAAKSAILESGSRRPPLIEARAQRILGLCSLANGQLIQGSSYLANSADLAAPAGDWMECARAKIAEAGCCLVMGDFSRAALIANETASLARPLRRHFPEEAARFLLGRIDFELGRYSGSSASFGALELLARDAGHEEVQRRARIWKARADCKRGETQVSRAILDSEYADPEARCFLAECLLGIGMTEAAAEAAAEAARLSGFSQGSFEARTESAFWSGADRFSWRDGFSSLEGLSVGFGSVRSLAADRILAFSLYAASLAEPRTAEENLETILSLARENRLATVHPYAYLYFYYAYRLSLLSECSGASPLSLLGRAFKALQLRAGKLNGEAEFTDFFESNREHAAIMKAARASKLM